MSKDNGFKQLVGRTITKVKVVGSSVLLKTEDDAFHIMVDDVGPCPSGALICTRDRKTTKKAKDPSPWPFPTTYTEDATLD